MSAAVAKFVSQRILKESSKNNFGKQVSLSPVTLNMVRTDSKKRIRISRKSQSKTAKADLQERQSRGEGQYLKASHPRTPKFLQKSNVEHIFWITA